MKMYKMYKMYKIFGFEPFTFEWEGGLFINVYWDGMPDKSDVAGVIELHEIPTDKEVGSICYLWLEDAGVVGEVTH